MQVVDPTTLKVTLVAPDGTWDQTLGAQLGNVPSPTAVAKSGALYGTSPETTVGAGAFVLKELVAGDHWTFAKNANYWDKPKPYLDSLTMKLVAADLDAAYNNFSCGCGRHHQHLRRTPEHPAARVAPNYTELQYQTSNSVFCFNNATGPTADLRVRQALVYGVNLPAVMQRAAPGVEAAPTNISDKSPYFVDLKVPKYDAKKAEAAIKSYLAEKGGTTVDVPLIIAQTSAQVGEAFKQDWDKIPGLNVTLQIETTLSTSTRIAQRNYTGMLNCGNTWTPRGLQPSFASTSSQNTYFWTTRPWTAR